MVIFQAAQGWAGVMGWVRKRGGIFEKFTGYFRVKPRQNPEETLCIHVLRTAGKWRARVIRALDAGGATSPSRHHRKNGRLFPRSSPVQIQKNSPAATSTPMAWQACGQRNVERPQSVAAFRGSNLCQSAQSVDKHGLNPGTGVRRMGA